MAFSYGFYDSVNGDRKYTALEMSSIFDGIITDGVLPNYLNNFKVIPGKGLSLIVQSGRAWFDHTWSLNSSNLLLYVNDADRVLTRYDAVVLEVNKARDVRANTIKLITGMPSTSPTRPQLMNTKEVKQYALAYIQVEPKLTAITTKLIQNMVGTPNTPYATSKLQATDISAVFQQWQGEFEEWYEGVKHITSGENIAALQAELAKKLPRSEKATTSTPISDNTKYLTPATGLALVDSQVNPIGTIVSTESSSLPSGNWIKCKNSNSLSTTGYPALFKDLGHSYGMPTRTLFSNRYSFRYGDAGTDSDGTVKYGVVMEGPTGDNSNVAPSSVLRMAPLATSDEGYRVLSARAKGPTRPVFGVFQIATKPRATGQNIPYYAKASVGYSDGKYDDLYGEVDWSGTLTPTKINVNSYDMADTSTGYKDGRVWLQDTLVSLNPVDYMGNNKKIVAVVDDTNKYIVYAGYNSNTKAGIIYVVVYSGGATNLAPDSIRSYDIDVPAYGGCWVFNNQIYYISNNKIYIVTFGSASPTLYTGSSEQQSIIKHFCERNYWLTDYINTGTIHKYPTIYSGYSFDNKIYIQFYDPPENNGNITGSYLYVDIALLKDEYTGEIERHRKQISLKPFKYNNYIGASGSSNLRFKYIKPAIKRNANGTVTIAFIIAMTYYPTVTASSWANVSYTFREEIWVGSVTGDDIKDDTNDIIYCINLYTAPKVSYDGAPAVWFQNYSYPNIKGNICEVLSDYIPAMWFIEQYRDEYNNPKFLQLAGFMLDMKNFRMPWLNDVTSTDVFHIRIS